MKFFGQKNCTCFRSSLLRQYAINRTNLIAGLILLFNLSSLDSFSQTTYFWRNDQNPIANENWNRTIPEAMWWRGFAEVPTGSEILSFDGNSTNMSSFNNLTATNRFRIVFENTNTPGARALNGSTSNTFFDFGGNTPSITNNSGVTHTINFPFLNGNAAGASRLELNANSGNFIFGSTIGASGGTRNLVATGASSITFNGLISNGSATLNFIKEGAGTALFNVANSYTGTTTIAAGTLRLGIANAIPNTNMTLSGGTLSTGATTGFNETIGVLSMNASSAISLGTGAHSLNFANSAGTWTGTLTINGWALGAGQIFFGIDNTGLNAGQLNQINFNGFGTGARILSTGEIVPRDFYFSNAANGNFTTGTDWLGNAAPVAGCTAVIRNGHNITLNTSLSLGNLTINTGGTFTGSDGAARTLTIAAGGTFSNSGTVNQTANGTLVFTGNGTFAGTSAIPLNNFSFAAGSTITISNSVSVVQAFTLASGAAYNFTFNNNNTFTCGGLTTTGANTLTLANGGSSTTGNRLFFSGGAVSVPTGSSLSLGVSSISLQVNGNVALAGTGGLTLSSATGGDIYLTGNWSRATGTFTPNGRAVFFNGTGIQTLAASGGTETFNFLFIQNSATVQLSSTNVTVNSSSGLSISSAAASTIDLNGNTLTLSGGGNLSLANGARTITSSLGTGLFAISTALAVSNAGTLSFGTSVTVQLTASFNPAAAATTINGTLLLNAGGFILTNAPIYGAASTLIYNNGAPYGIGTEWTSGAASGAGYPNNVQVGLTVANSALSIGAGTYNCGGNFTFSGTITGAALTMTTGTLNIGGSWVNNATPAAANFTRGTGTVGFTGTGIHTIGGSNTSAGGYAFNNLTVNKTLGSVTLNNAITVANTLTVSGGTFTLNGYSLSVVNLAGTSTAAVINNNTATNIILTITDGSNNTCAAAIQNGSTGTISIVKSGAGAQSLSGNNTYSGTTTVSAGTLGIGSASSGAGLSSASNYTFSGGNLTIANLPAASVLNGGTINIQANTSITLTGPNAYTVNFAASNLVAWDLSRTVTIFNWTPSAGRVINMGTNTGLTFPPIFPNPNNQVSRINFDNYGVGSKLVGIELRPAFLYVTQASGAGNYTTPGSWLFNDQPLLNDGSESIFIQGTFALTFDNLSPILNVLRAEIAPVASLTMAAGERINIFPTGDFRVNGTINMLGNSYIDLRTGTNFQLGGTVTMSSTAVVAFASGISMIATSPSANFSSAGTLDFAGAFTITSNTPNAVLLPNVNLRASVDFGQNSTIQNGSSLFMLPGGFVNNNAPTYAAGSTLVYNTGGPYNRSLEWSATSGKGYPSNVTIGTTTIFSLSNGTPGTARQMGGNLTINSGTQFTMEDGGGGMSAPLTVLGNVIVNGELRLGNAIGGDIRVGGNYTVGPTAGLNGTVFNNNRAVIFVGSNGDQVVTKTGGGIVYFDFIVINKPQTPTPGDLKMSANTNAWIISQVNNDLSLRVLQLLSGGLDMNAGIMTLQGDNINSLNIFVDGGATRRIFTSTGSGEFRITGTLASGVPKLSVTAGSVGSRLLFDNNVLVTTNVGVNFGAAGITTINAQLRIDQNGYIITHSPDYGPQSTLIYNNGPGGYKRNMEWNTNTPGATGAGYPNNVVVQNNTPVDLNSTDFPATFPLGCSGKLTIESGSSLATGSMAHTLSVGDSLNLRGTLTLSTNAAGDFFVGGNWNRSSTGVFVQNDRMVTFDSTNAATIRAAGGQTFTRLTINKKTTISTIAVDSAVTVTNELFLQRGALTLNNDITLTSDNTRTARIGETTNPADISVTYGAGKFVIQRYLPIANNAAARRWRLMTAPLKTSNAPTINEAWQEGQVSTNRLTPVNTTPGFGTAITWGTTSANGYDQGITNNPSIARYNTVTNAWEGIPSTTSGKITDQPGYMLFVRGDRSIVITGTTDPATPTTLRTRGEIHIGGVTTALNGTGYQVLGNPYASAISFNNVTFNGVNPGTTAGRTFYMWDPKLLGSRNVGGQVTFTSLGNGTYAVTANSSGYLNTGIIESGAAIMVPAAGGNFTFSENCKIAASSTVGLASRPAGNAATGHDFFTTNLYAVVGGVPQLADGVVNIGHDNFDSEVNMDDAPKLISFSSAEKISIVRDGRDLSVELKKKLKAGDTIFYKLSRLSAGSYQLTLEGKNIDNGLVAVLEDKFTGDQKLLDINATAVYPFDVTADSNSAGSRFRVVFRSAVQFTVLAASAVNGNIVTSWATVFEHNIAKYEVERSSDGSSFIAVGTVPAGSIAAGSYLFSDASPKPGNYVYRIKAVTATGGSVYSNTAKVNLYRQTNSVYVFPNPVQDGLIRLHMDKQPAGIYHWRLFNSNGQQVYNGALNHAAGNVLQEFRVPGLTAGGIYQLEITRTNSLKIVLPVLVK